MFAAEGGHLNICRSLLNLKELDVEIRNHRGRTALHIAALKDRADIIRVLLSEKAKVNAKDKDGKTPLHLAAQAGRRDAVKALAKSSAIDLELPDKEGRSAFHLASLKGKHASLKVLAEKGANVDAKDGKQRTAFLDAASAADVELLKVLQSCGADVNQRTALHKWSALHYCVSRDNLKCLHAVLEFPGINLDVLNSSERTPLHEAVLKSRGAFVQALADKGAKVDTRDGKKRSPFLDAAKAGRPRMLRTLRGRGADVDQVSGRNGWSALHEAANGNHVKVVEYLVSEGIDVGLKVKGGTRKGMTAKEIAEARESKDVLEFLRDGRSEVQTGE